MQKRSQKQHLNDIPTIITSARAYGFNLRLWTRDESRSVQHCNIIWVCCALLYLTRSTSNFHAFASSTPLMNIHSWQVTPSRTLHALVLLITKSATCMNCAEDDATPRCMQMPQSGGAQQHCNLRAAAKPLRYVYTCSNKFWLVLLNLETIGNSTFRSCHRLRSPSALPQPLLLLQTCTLTLSVSLCSALGRGTTTASAPADVRVYCVCQINTSPCLDIQGGFGPQSTL